MRLGLRAVVAVAAGRVAAAASRMLGRGRGQVVGGRIMLRLDPKLLRKLAAGKAVSLVSATNGKSTTTRMLVQAMSSLGPVAHNATGANMAPGLVTALATNMAASIAALEVDEAHLPALAKKTGAGQIVLLNLSRDQLDRGAEVKMLAGRWRQMAADLGPAVRVVANADDPMVVWAASQAANLFWIGMGLDWTEDSMLCPNSGDLLVRQDGDWWCPGCDLRRPATTWAVAVESSELVTANGRWPIKLALPGGFNLGNAAIATAAAAHYGVPVPKALAACALIDNVDGRYITTSVNGHAVRLLLGKNPASWTEMAALVDGSEAALCAALNSRGADGRDPSWIWDVPFERLAGRPVWVSGERRFDLAVRLEVAGLEVRGVSDDPLDALADLPAGASLDVVANYTSFQELRSRLVAD
ncbi:MAG: MurT ligase domain-containing protein [Micrococcales bacterium]|nr:MurT ligase domain-containing protein [Micrococcales bacterium]